MNAFACHAAEFLCSPGPAPVPLRACCAAAIIRSATAHPPAADLPSAPFVCAAAGLTTPLAVRPAHDPAGSGLTVPPVARLADDPAAVGAEQVR
jgi:hypothetical protein